MFEEKLAIVNEMVELGYHLMNRTAEEMANLFTLEQLQNSLKTFKKWLGK